MSVATSVRPSSLPLPKTLTHSNPAERFRQKRSESSSKENSPSLYRANLVLPTHQRVKLNSTSSSTGSNTPSTTPTYERQVKSLTPDREFHKGGPGSRTANPALRKVSSSKTLLGARNNRELSVTKTGKTITKTTADRVTSNNARNTHRSTITVKTKDLRSGVSGPTNSVVQRSSQGVTRKISPNATRVGAKRSKDNSKDKIQTKTLGTGGNTRTSYHQPDLVKVGSDLGVEAKEREIQRLRSQVTYNAKAFDALSISFDYLANKIDGLEAPVLRRQLEDLKFRLAIKDKSIECLTDQRQQDLKHFEDETSQQKAQTDLLTREFELKVGKVKEQHQKILDKVNRDHKEAIGEIIEHRINDLTEQDKRHEHEVQGHQMCFKAQLDEMDAKWQQKLLQSLENKQNEMRKFDQIWQTKEEKWLEGKQSLEEQIHLLQTEIKEQEVLSRAKNKGDLQIQAAHKKTEKISAEADSLKTVLELKTHEVHVLRNEKVRMEEKLEEFDRIRLELSKANAIVEDLKAQVAKKTNLERKLSAENRKLYTNIERESCEKKRLSMENEELHWKIRQSMDSLSLSTVEGHDTSASSDQFEAMNKLSCSFSEGCTKSLPPFMGRITNRPFHAGEYGPISESSASSADSGADFDLFDPRSQSRQGRTCPAGMEASACDPVPDSPRVLEVVKKTESVAWKLEYDELMGVFPPCYTPSPSLSRKVSPNSPRMPRRSSSQSMENVHVPCKPDSLALNRSNSVRKKAVHTFETVSESSESPELLRDELKPILTPTTPDPVNIGGDFEDLGSEISSSSEIEINEVSQCEAETSGLSSPEEGTVREVSQIGVAKQVREIQQNPMNRSLPSYDLQNLFCPQPKDSGGESMMISPDGDEVLESSEDSSGGENNNIMTDSLSAVSWSDDMA
eukprot:maker-scaffold345_size201316-snap-gene-1.22 protein:Tk12174 transcript:maker-scaffold345_size201316-snap-gene-1.22-mRNA-1 annotation:"hypothetical protein BRAFLDRAFT_63857"